MKGKDRKGFWFLAPYRSERNASLHIGYNNLWYDYGIGKGGDIFTLAGEMIGSGDFIKQAEYISQVMKVPMPDGYRPEPMPKVRQEPAFENIDTGFQSQHSRNSGRHVSVSLRAEYSTNPIL